jgi:hypothetical protein
MDQINKILLIWLAVFMVVTAIIAIHLFFASASSAITMLVDPRDGDAILSCDDEICKHDLKIATLDETLKINNVTSLLK